jgi:BirA family transcriptional regulator, biotin operon repressor / biotin---[acetyl-CoA-carboxylase] ligase
LVAVLPSTDSTNAEALRRLRLQSAPFVVVAERQTAGRGRRGRAWVSPFAENLYYSLVLRVEGGVTQLEGMSLVVGLAIAQAVRAFGVKNVGLKWPNDVLAGGCKLAGILLELSGDPADVCHLVIGVGINTNMLSGQQDIDQPWTSMRNELGVPIDRNQLVIELGNQLARYLALHREHGFCALLDEWEANHLWQGRMVSLSSGASTIKGVVLGVSHTGAIRLSVDGVELSFSGGELSLRLSDDS